MVRARFVSFVVLSIAAFAPLAAAQQFSDVPDDYAHANAIAALFDRSVLKGNPDGTFRPYDEVNRAELLTILYRATGRVPEEPRTACYKDVALGGWYTPVVCDASTRGYVSGYPDGNFRPEKKVNRVEALKMIHTVFGFSSPGDTFSSVNGMYEDLDDGAWYAPYIAGALYRRVIPIAGQEGPDFQPNKPLTRGEAAAYVANALGLDPASASSAQSSSDESSEGASSDASEADQSSSRSSGQAAKKSQDTAFPFDDAGTFAAKEKAVYRFSLTKQTIASITATVDPHGGIGGLSCRLYKLSQKTSFSSEYYLGYVTGNTCIILAAIGEGNYQLEMQPRTAGAAFTVKAETAEGDGNDGFSEAEKLMLGKSVGAEIGEGDIADWYTFSLMRQQTMKVGIENGDGVTCMVYAMEDVDLYGFSGPQCNETYDYPRGTYVIGVQRKDGRKKAEGFTLLAK